MQNVRGYNNFMASSKQILKCITCPLEETPSFFDEHQGVWDSTCKFIIRKYVFSGDIKDSWSHQLITNDTFNLIYENVVMIKFFTSRSAL